MKDHGIVHQKKTPRTPEKNRVAELLNFTIMDRVRTILIEFQLPLSYWAEAVGYAVHISNLRVFSSQCYAHNDFFFYCPRPPLLLLPPLCNPHLPILLLHLFPPPRHRLLNLQPTNQLVALVVLPKSMRVKIFETNRRAQQSSALARKRGELRLGTTRWKLG